jgi:hypothetical protein
MRTNSLNQTSDFPLLVDCDKISAIKSLRAEYVKLEKQLNKLTHPILSDFTLIDMIYSIFCDVILSKDTNATITDSYQQKKFIMVVLYLYSPRSLAGENMRKGLRQRIATAVGAKVQSSISIHASNVIVLYRSYRDFRRDVNLILTRVYNELGIEVQGK